MDARRSQFDLDYTADLIGAGRCLMLIGLAYGVKYYDHMLSRFHLIPERYGRTDGQTDGQTDLLYQYRASVC